LQIVKGTALAIQYAQQPFHLYTVEEYIDLIIKYISQDRHPLKPSMIHIFFLIDVIQYF